MRCNSPRSTEVLALLQPNRTSWSSSLRQQIYPLCYESYDVSTQVACDIALPIVNATNVC